MFDVSSVVWKIKKKHSIQGDVKNMQAGDIWKPILARSQSYAKYINEN